MHGYTNGIAVAGSIAYLADGPYGLRVVDVSNPSQPAEVGSAYLMNYAFKVAVQGRYAYVAPAGAGLLIADVGNPARPIEVGSLATAGYAYGVAVAGHTAFGIEVQGSTTNRNLILGNYVGTDVTGTAGLANSESGITIDAGAHDNVVQGNLSSGNAKSGVNIWDWGSSYNVVIGNRIGTDWSGTKAIPNYWGVFLGSSFNRIGGRREEDGNVISGNLSSGVELRGPTTGNLVLGNYIGTDSSGTRSLGNEWGVLLNRDSRAIVGGTTSREANVISAAGAGVWVDSDYAFVAGNCIGTDLSGNIPMGNRHFAALVSGKHNVLQANLIAHSEENGVVAEPGTWTTIRRNSIYDNAGVGIANPGSGSNDYVL